MFICMGEAKVYFGYCIVVERFNMLIFIIMSNSTSTVQTSLDCPDEGASLVNRVPPDSATVDMEWKLGFRVKGFRWLCSESPWKREF